MQEVNIISKTKQYVACPHCGDDTHSISHLLGENTTFGSWYCDSCGHSFGGKIENGRVFIKKEDKTKYKNFVILRHDKVILVVEGMHFEPKINYDTQRYLYDEHTCPTNYMKHVKIVMDLETLDTDPHGIFEYVTTIPYVDENDIDKLEDRVVCELNKAGIKFSPETHSN